MSTGISLTPARLRMLRRLCVLRGFYVNGSDVRAAKWLAARGLVALEDNGSLRGHNDERWYVTGTDAGRRLADEATPVTTSTTIAAMDPPADTAPPWHTAPALPWLVCWPLYLRGGGSRCDGGAVSLDDKGPGRAAAGDAPCARLQSALAELPTIEHGHDADLKISLPALRVWLSRLTAADGERYAVHVEIYRRGEWHRWYSCVPLIAGIPPGLHLTP